MASSAAAEARVRHMIERRLSAPRRRHSLEVAALAEEICGRYGSPAPAGRIAGLAHDAARELEPDEIRALASEDGGPLDADESDMPLLLHGRAAAVLLRREAGVEDADVLAAVRDHVTGRPGMSTLSLVLFAADYFEPSRLIMSEEERRAALAGSLEAMVLEALRGTVAYLQTEGRRVARVTRDLEEWLVEELRKHGQ